MKKRFFKLASVFLSISIILGQSVIALAGMGDEISANASPQDDLALACPRAVLGDYETGEILYSKSPDEKCSIASITKIMTLILVAEALENGEISLGDEVCCSREASSMGGSQIWLKEGEKMTVEQLIKAVSISSANDAAYALAEHIKSSHSAFVNAMNKKAKAIGMENTSFKNCTGLDEEGHYSTARDVFLMSRELLSHSSILTYSKIWMDSLRDGKTSLVNTNRLIRFYKGATGLKTGTTDKAGCCLSASASRDGLSLISVTLGDKTSKERFSSAKALLDYGFSEYAFFEPKRIDNELSAVKVCHGVSDLVSLYARYPKGIVIKKDEKSQLSQEISIEEKADAPIKRGDKLGSCNIYSGDKLILSYDICALDSVPRLSLGLAFKRLLGAI